MEPVLIALALIVGVGAGYAVETLRRRPQVADAERQAQRILEDAERQAGAQLKEAQVAAREELLAQRTEQERDLAERRGGARQGRGAALGRARPRSTCRPRSWPGATSRSPTARPTPSSCRRT